MRVITGKSGKSRRLEAQMQLLDKSKTILFDSVGVPVIAHLAEFYFEVKNTEELIIALGEVSKNEQIKNVVLELNCPAEFTSILLEWEKISGKNFIVTVQDNELDRIMMYDMTLTE